MATSEEVFITLLGTGPGLFIIKKCPVISFVGGKSQRVGKCQGEKYPGSEISGWELLAKAETATLYL